VMNGVSDDVGHVLVGQRVNGLATTALDPHQPGAAQYPQVLRYQRLAHPEARDQLVHKAGLLSQLRDDGQSRRGGQHFEQFPGSLKSSRLRRHQII
jgi:hypothetical protein